jgi:Flp pilus assembly protein TadG
MIRDEIHQTEDAEVMCRKPHRWMFWARFCSIIKRTKGQAFAIAALSLPVLVGGAALAVDVAHIYVAKSVMQNAVDASSRAGASILAEGGTEADATTTATSYALENLSTYSYVANVAPTITFPTSESVNVVLTHAVPLFFAPVFGEAFETISVETEATAGLSSVS